LVHGSALLVPVIVQHLLEGGLKCDDEVVGLGVSQIQVFTHFWFELASVVLHSLNEGVSIQEEPFLHEIGLSVVVLEHALEGR